MTAILSESHGFQNYPRRHTKPYMRRRKRTAPPLPKQTSAQNLPPTKPTQPGKSSNTDYNPFTSGKGQRIGRVACGRRLVTFGLACMARRIGALGRALNQGGRPASEPNRSECSFCENCDTGHISLVRLMKEFRCDSKKLIA